MKRRIYSGTCLCGHSYEDHHLGIVFDAEAYAAVGPYVPEECEFFGSNENGGFDENDQVHCKHYIDADDPDPETRASWKGTRRTAFRKRIFSGTCLCGHTYENHHLLPMLLNPEDQAYAGPLPEECEFFGSNEGGGLDENGQPHCKLYVDVDEPDPETRGTWQGTRR